MKRLTTEEFIEKAKNIHGDKHDYSLVEYINADTKIKVICKEHNIMFLQIPNSHLMGMSGCFYCKGKKIWDNRKRLTNYDFINRAKIIHNNKYNYSKVEYTKAKDKIIIICPIHGEFKQSAEHHLRGYGCYKCCGKQKTTEDFILKAKEIHKNKYNYSKTEYVNCKDKITIICSIHGEFKQSPEKHLSGQGCYKCRQSQGENKISEYLKNKNIEYINQKKFKDCKNKKSLPFDFYLPKYNLCIEYDGEQHYIIREKRFGSTEKPKEILNQIKQRDKIKDDYCKINNINLLRIKYDQFNNIEKILKEYLDFNIKYQYNINMEKTAKKIVKKIQNAGYTCVYAGGHVRDLLLNNIRGIKEDSHDIDIATDCPIEKLKELFNHVILVGESFGVIRVIEDSFEFEIAQFRTDSKNSDGRRPDSVEFTSDLELDAQRRDFTINGLFYDPITDKVIDFVGGGEDIKKGLVRFIGDPKSRINEDFLRMLRFCRFIARFGEYDQESFNAVKENSHKIKRISEERIREELEKGLSLENTSFYIDLLMKTGLMHEILPELEVLNNVEQSPLYHPEGNVLPHIKLVIEALKGESLNLKFAALFHDIGKVSTTEVQEDGKITSRGHAEIGKEITEVILKRLKFSNSDIEYICSLVGDHMKLIDFIKMSKSSKRKLVSKEYFSDLYKLHKADKMNRRGMFKDDIEEAVETFLKEYSEQIKLPKPFIDGKDIIFLGLKEGREIGKIKELLYDMQLEGLLFDRKSALVKAKEIIRDYYLDKLLKNT